LREAVSQPAVSSAGLEEAARPLTRHASNITFSTSGHGQPAKAGDCQDQQCAEEECDPDECGDENRAPKQDNYVFGIDKRPLLPVLLLLSTIIAALHMMLLEFPLIRDMLEGAYFLRAFFLVLYVVTLGCMAYCALCDPGTLKRKVHSKAYDRLRQAQGNSDSTAELPLPKRCHKSWLFERPIRRYDHYCRWLTNCIGLLNHREFIVMVAGLVILGICGCGVDTCLVVLTSQRGDEWLTASLLIMHLTYSVILTALAYPILRLHIGFICRNELANEWKKNDHYVVTSNETGKCIPVNELSDDEFNDKFDTFEYDKTRNGFDKDVAANCWAFWCTPRWTPDQLGEF